MSPIKSSNVLVTRLLAGAAAIAIFAWSVVDGRFHDAEGYLTGSICLPWAASFGLIVWGVMVRTSWNRFARWFAVALIGQAVALQLIDAGPRLHYQHYGLASEFWKPSHAWLLLLLTCQTVAVLVATARRGRTVLGAIRRSIGFWRGAAILFLVCLVSAPVSRHIPDYFVELPFAAFVQLLNLATAILMVGAMPTAPTSKFVDWIDARFGRRDESGELGLGRFAFAGALWVTVLAALLNAVSYEGHPHVQDEVAYLQQARTVASGALTAPAPAARSPFELYLMEFGGDRWYGTPPVGWPAVLSLGVAAGIPSMVNPVLGGLNTFLAAMLVAQLYDRRTARLVVLLLCLSPWYVFMAMNYMTHTASLTCALLGALALLKSRRTRRAPWALAGGMAIGYLSLIRPLEGLVMAVLLGLWAIGIGGQRLTIASIAAFVAGTCAIGSLVLPYNQCLTGSATTFPIMAYADAHMGHRSNAFGFGADRGTGWALDPWPGHSPRDAMVNSNLNLFSMNVEMLGWSVGSFLFLAILALCGRWSRADRLMLAVIVAIIGIHVFYWFGGGPDFGARYWYLLIVPCIALTVRGIQLTADKLADAFQRQSESVRRVMVGVVFVSIMTLINYFPWRAIDKYHHYLHMRPDVAQIAESHEFGRSLVLVRGVAHPDYASAAVFNPLDLNADGPIYAWDRSPKARADALNAYPDRRIWILDGPSVTGRGFEVVAGPLRRHDARLRTDQELLRNRA